MFLNTKKSIILFLIVIILIVIIPISFAEDNVTLSNQTSNHYYFDSNVENDTGNGSFSNPYKYLTDERVPDNSVIHLADGEYNFTHRIAFVIMKTALHGNNTSSGNGAKQ